MGVKIVGSIEKVNAKDLSYSDFVEQYLVKNKPVVLTGLMDDWRACRDWVLDDGEPNLKFFSTHFGNSRVQVADCGTKEFTDQKRLEMSVAEFVEHWVLVSSDESNGFSPLYLKDWHFVKEYPEYTAYTTPVFFLDDWLNIHLDQFRMHQNPDTCQEKDDISCSDYRFVYMGAKGTWTPLHADVFRSYSWSANVCGQKHWYFLPPDQSHMIFDRNMKCSVYDIFEDVNETMFPGFDKAMWSQCIQEQNEIIFVPSGWFHQVHNLEDTISINHNWFNAYNLSWVWDLLLRDYNEAKEYIEDIKDICDDFEGLCQRNLAANTGMNFNDFFIFIVHFSLANLVLLYTLSQEYENPIRSSSQKAKHLAYNLESAKEITVKLKSMAAISNRGFSVDVMEIQKDPAFLQMCKVLGRTYEMLHDPYNLGRSWEDLVNDIGHFNTDECLAYHVCNPETLASMIDSALKKLSHVLDVCESR